MRIVLLGTAGYHPNARRHTACFLLPELGVVLDAGTGMFRVREWLQTTELDIFLSHVHLDHCFGLSFLFDVKKDTPLARVSVHAAPDKLRAINAHLLDEQLFPVALPCDYRELAHETRVGRDGRLSWFPLAHPCGSVGYRLDLPGGSLAYVTDTTAAVDAPYVDAIRGVDLLLHECNFTDAERELAVRTGHSHTTPVAQVAAAAGVKRLVLIHLNPLVEEGDPVGLDVARAIFPNTELGFDNQVIEF
ncbi:MAG: MBL fold metallo-hydrolase [Pirellulales bacterium]|nr:MBL fold metallo-hydrolase [Pirellulales bacterium]